MPCRDYESDNWGVIRSAPNLKGQMDKLARIACKAMEALEKDGRADFLLLEDDEVREWWMAHQEADRKERARVAEQQRREAVKQEALNKLSDEEKELLGLKKPKQVKKVHPSPEVVEYDEDVDSIKKSLMDAFEQTKVQRKLK